MSLKLTSDLFLLLGLLGLTAVALSGWGRLTWRLLGITQPDRPTVLSIWLGICIVIAVIEIIHLFFAIDWRVSLAVAITGLAGQYMRLGPRKAKEVTLRNSGPVLGMASLVITTLRCYPLRSAVGSLVILVWCLRAMETPTMFDSGLYHFGSIRWLNEYPIIPGLGNLHWRLALNQSYFGFLALLNVAPYWGKGYATGGLFLLLLTAFTLLEVALRQSKLWRWIFGGILFLYLCLLSGTVANPLPDVAVALLQVVIFLLLYHYVTVVINPGTPSGIDLQCIQTVVLFLCLTVVTVKFSSLAFGFASFVLMSILILRSDPHRGSKPRLWKLVLLISIFGLVHIARSYLLSGTPFFPNPLGGVWSLPWAVDFGVAQNESELILAWARQPGAESLDALSDGRSWFLEWADRLPRMFKILFVLGTLFLINTIIFYKKKHKKIILPDCILVLPIFLAFCFWFLYAPDPRFLGATLILYFSISTHAFATVILEQAQVRNKISIFQRKAFGRFALLVSIALFYRWSFVSDVPVGWQPLPDVALKTEFNRLGFEAFVPSNSAQCWDAAIPCTPLLHGSLRQVFVIRPRAMIDMKNRFWFEMQR